MTDLETIFVYRMGQAEEMLAEAAKMLTSGFSPRSIVNRSYYAMFYAVLALFIHTNTPHKTSNTPESSGYSTRSSSTPENSTHALPECSMICSMNGWNWTTGTLLEFQKKVPGAQWSRLGNSFLLLRS